MRIDDGKGAKAFAAMLDDPDIKDMFVINIPSASRALRQPSISIRDV